MPARKIGKSRFAPVAGNASTCGLSLDLRYYLPLLLVCDRGNRRLCHFDLDGKCVRTVNQHLRRPCQVSFHGRYAVISELEGALTFSMETTRRCFFGRQSAKTAVGEFELDPSDLKAGVFSAAHACWRSILNRLPLAEVSKQEKDPSKSFLIGIKKLVNQILALTVESQKVTRKRRRISLLAVTPSWSKLCTSWPKLEL